MISILPERNREVVKELYKKCGLTATNGCEAVVAKSRDEILGFCLSKVSEDSYTIQHIEPLDDLSLADGIIRSAIHVGFENGKQNFFWDNDNNTNVFEKLGFIKDLENRILNSDKLFESCCGCTK